MFKSNFKPTSKDARTLLQDAQALFETAAALTGEKADEVRQRGMDLLDLALLKAQDVQASVLVVGKEMASLTDGYVKESPWRAVAAAAGTGLLAGVILQRCCSRS